NSLEAQLSEIWVNVLAIDRVGVDDSFWDLGGDSLLATETAKRVQDSFGAELAASALLEFPTVASLAGELRRRARENEDANDSASTPHRVLSAEWESAEADCLVTLRERSGSGTVFLFPPASGQVFPYMALVRAMNIGQSVYGFRSPELVPRASLLKLEAKVE